MIPEAIELSRVEISQEGPQSHYGQMQRFIDPFKESPFGFPLYCSLDQNHSDSSSGRRENPLVISNDTNSSPMDLEFFSSPLFLDLTYPCEGQIYEGNHLEVKNGFVVFDPRSNDMDTRISYFNILAEIEKRRHLGILNIQEGGGKLVVMKDDPKMYTLLLRQKMTASFLNNLSSIYLAASPENLHRIEQDLTDLNGLALFNSTDGFKFVVGDREVVTMDLDSNPSIELLEQSSNFKYNWTWQGDGRFNLRAAITGKDDYIFEIKPNRSGHQDNYHQLYHLISGVVVSIFAPEVIEEMVDQYNLKKPEDVYRGDGSFFISSLRKVISPYLRISEGQDEVFNREDLRFLS